MQLDDVYMSRMEMRYARNHVLPPELKESYPVLGATKSERCENTARS